jgi:membrane associated rhomboid family serine protease
MNDAAVGFQCPSCLAEGRKTTRTARTAYGGLRSTNPGATTMALIGINLFVWVTIVATGWQDSRLIDRLALIPAGRCVSDSTGGTYTGFGEQACNTRAMPGDGVWFPGVSDGAYWQLLTSAFAHVQVWHIGFNMLALWILGPQLELVLGRARFLALYFLSALAGSALVYWAAPENQLTIGASGAVFGLLGALLVVAYKVGGNVQPLLILLAINAVITFTVPNVSWQGHLGGFLGGVAIAAALVYAPRTNRTRYQVSMLVAIACTIAVAVIARTAMLA